MFVCLLEEHIHRGISYPPGAVIELSNPQAKNLEKQKRCLIEKDVGTEEEPDFEDD